MAKQGKVLPARRQRDAIDDSLLIRSAESLGRVIGSLQRQLDGASKRIGDRVHDVREMLPINHDGHGAPKTTVVKRTAKKETGRTRAAGAGRSKAADAKTKSTGQGKSKRAATSSRARKTSASGGARTKTASRSRR